MILKKGSGGALSVRRNAVSCAGCILQHFGSFRKTEPFTFADRWSVQGKGGGEQYVGGAIACHDGEIARLYPPLIVHAKGAQLALTKG